MFSANTNNITVHKGHKANSPINIGNVVLYKTARTFIKPNGQEVKIRATYPVQITGKTALKNNESFTIKFYSVAAVNGSTIYFEDKGERYLPPTLNNVEYHTINALNSTRNLAVLNEVVEI